MIDFQAHDSYKNILGRVAKPYVNIDQVEEVNQGVKDLNYSSTFFYEKNNIW